MNEETRPALLPELLPVMALQEGSDWLQHLGIAKSPKGLIAAAAEGKIRLFSGVPVGAHRGFLTKPPPDMPTMMPCRWPNEDPPPTMGKVVAVLGLGVPFDDLEMLEIPPDRCMQFLQIGEAHIRDAEAPDRAVIDQLGWPEIQDLAKVLVIRDIAAFRVMGADLEVFAAVHAPAQPGTPASSASASAGADPEPVAPSAVAVPAPMPRQRYQEAEVLRVLRELGHDPAALPARPHGKPGAKAEAWRLLAEKKWSRGVFDKAWERLKALGEVVGD